MTTLAPTFIFKGWANNGSPLAYGQLTTYAAGSTTPIATYTDSTGGTPNPNPITLNARGECPLWLTPNVFYKFSLADAQGNLISGYPVDNVVNNQLLTLFAGTDSGVANAYVLTYSAPYTSYSAGNPVIYFIASHSNTGASTVNVNNLGIVNIVNPNQTPLTAGQIVAGQMTQIVWQTGQFILTSIGATAGIGIGTFGAEVTQQNANVTDLGATGSHTINSLGSSVITSFGTSASINAPIFVVRFTGQPLITYNATSLITPSGGNISVNSGDAMLAEYLGSGNWKILLYQSAVAGNMFAVRVSTAVPIATNTTPAPDAQLFIAIGQTGTYAINGWINDAAATSSGGLKGGIGFTGSMLAGYWGMTGTGSGTTNVGLTAINSYAELQSAQTGVASMLISGMIQVSATGTLSFNWAQNSSNATGSIISSGSYLDVTLLSVQAGSFAPVTYSFNVPTTTTFAIPTGATTMTVECWGGSGAGSFTNTYTAGAGGGSGGYAKTVATVTGDGGQTITYTVGGPSGTSSVASGTFAISTMTCSGGGAASGSTPGTAGAASGGGATNTAGNAGGAVGTPGAGIVGTYGTGPYGGIGTPMPPAGNGSNGLIVLHFA